MSIESRKVRAYCIKEHICVTCKVRPARQGLTQCGRCGGYNVKHAMESRRRKETVQ